jgi:DNA-binding CsgD family transcriptional regulator
MSDPIFPRSIKDDPPVSELTPRQLEIPQSSARGLTNDDLAKLFGISPSGVKHHLSTIFAKRGASSRSEAIAIAMRKHLLKTEDV